MKEEKSLYKDTLVPAEIIERRIFLLRRQKIMLSIDLAGLYQVKPSALIQAVKRNIERFPEDFMFQLTVNEAVSLKSQIVISNIGRGGRRHSPYAFTEMGVAMLSSVLQSDRAVQMNIFIMRTFTKLRQMIAGNKDLASQVNKLELDLIKQEMGLADLYTYVKKFMDTPIPLEEKIGFNVEK